MDRLKEIIKFICAALYLFYLNLSNRKPPRVVIFYHSVKKELGEYDKMFRVQSNISHPGMHSHGYNSSRCERVVNLSLHGIGKPARELLSPNEEKWWLSQATLMSIMDVVSEYKDVRLSIDDGNISDVEIVLPALLKHDMKVSFFISAGMHNVFDRRNNAIFSSDNDPANYDVINQL